MFVSIILLILWFVLLVKWSDFFIDWASGLAKKYKLSEMFIGLTIVAFGTSAPELFVNIQSAFQGHTQLALANIIGSNIANLALILWIGIILWTFAVAKKVNKDILLSFVFGFLLFALLFIGKDAPGYLPSILIWVLLLGLFFTYFAYTYHNHSLEVEPLEPVVSKKIRILLLMILGGLWAITLWGNLVVDSAVKIAEFFGVSSRIIWLTIVSLWTSLPELMTTIVSLKKGHHEIWVWNIIWSNIFNIGLIWGITSLIHPIVFEAGSYYDFIVLFIITILLFLFVKYNKAHMKKWQGILFLWIYIIYILSLIVLN